MNEKRRMKEIEQDVEWYKPKKRIANAMRELGQLGFRATGHGCGLCGEDFGLSFDVTKESYYYVNLCDEGRKVIATFTFDNGDFNSKLLAEGTIGKVLAVVRKEFEK